MNSTKKLAGKRIAVLAADGFENVELVAPVAALKEAGAQVVIVALHAGRIRGMNVHPPAELLQVEQSHWCPRRSGHRDRQYRRL